MGDLLVKLYDLPPLEPALERIRPTGIRLHRPIAPERYLVVNWVADQFNTRWGAEASMAFSGHPISCFVALDENADIVGFACYNTTFKGFFGPTGVTEECRGKGVGTALMIRALHALRDDGHAYGIIGGSGADDYYIQMVKAIPIADSDPGPYGGRIRFDKG